MPLIRHLVFFHFAEQLPDGHLQRTLDTLDRLRNQHMPGVLFWRCCRTLIHEEQQPHAHRISPHGFLLVLDSLFDSVDSLQQFLHSIPHNQLIESADMQHVDRFIPLDCVLPDDFDVAHFTALQQPRHVHRAIIVLHPNGNVTRQRQVDIARRCDALKGRVAGLLDVRCHLAGRPGDGQALYVDAVADEEVFYTCVVDVTLQQRSDLEVLDRDEAYHDLDAVLLNMTDAKADGLLAVEWGVLRECGRNATAGFLHHSLLRPRSVVVLIELLYC